MEERRVVESVAEHEGCERGTCTEPVFLGGGPCLKEFAETRLQGRVSIQDLGNVCICGGVG